jgi:hypothetical protein
MLGLHNYIYQYISLFTLKVELTALLKTALTFKRGSLPEKNYLFHNKLYSDINLKKVLGFKFSMYFKYFFSKKLVFVHFYNKSKLKKLLQKKVCTY